MKPIAAAGLLHAVWFLVVSQLLLAGEVQAQSGPHERAIAEAYANWVETVNDKDLNAWASYLAPEALFFPPNSPILAGRAAIFQHYTALFADDQFSLTCRQEHVEVAASEDIAWAYGHCQSTFTGSDGQLAHGSTKWVKVWRRQPSGEWKCAVNSWSSTVPITPVSGEQHGARPNEALAQELEQIGESDQHYRSMMDSVSNAYGFDSDEMRALWVKQNATDSINLIRIREIIERYGYPGTSLVGDQNQVAWYVIQHADLPTQEEYLPLLRDAATEGELPMSAYALTVDRVRMRRGEKQLYGSQIQRTGDTFVIYPIEDEPNVNKRRAEVGLQPLEEYVKQWGIEYTLPETPNDDQK